MKKQEENEFLPSIDDFIERFRFHENKVLNRQLFERFIENIEDFRKKYNKTEDFIRVSSNKEVSINLSEFLLTISFEKRETLSTLNNKNQPDFYQVKT